MERVVVVGCGAVGSVVARRLRAGGVHVTGTTTRTERLDEVARACDAAVVVRGGDAVEVAGVVAEADAVVVCVSPPQSRATSVEGRTATYREALVATARSLVDAVGRRPVVAVSSLSVLGAGEGRARLDEQSLLPDLDDPSPVAYREMEQAYLQGLPGQATILRTGDIVSEGDPPLVARVRLAHEHLGGSVPFDDRALAYRVTDVEVAEVVAAVLAAGPQGVLHVVPAEVPPTNAELYGRACIAAGLPPLDFRRELATPVVPVATRLGELGLRLSGPTGP